MEILFLIGRILFGGFFLWMGIGHFTKKVGLIAYAQSRGVSSTSAAVLLSGVMVILGGVGIILGVFIDIALWLIIIFLVFVSFMIHKFWEINDPSQRMVEANAFMKNIALLGAALMMLIISSPWAISLGSY
ncbi:MAG: DoxX family protein [Candidatus Harrisonbacteria bacterium CG10_big_fil_rev_8_21_14_0_10_44_23]|uniref:DoxX family protein n=1 Tax=Candidatus Harrisonbacteria bacterium CG10_big_fil_rev_8_21_14_0_10_44_23 TaxID=1974585 RepID=A0A2H0UQ08_9BACT|nr:MAG: DoxX family protein [Candidatus Harrisonbacteria bacterium CG10_big_fil_rev_8_21_14_0_10_44_23]